MPRGQALTIQVEQFELLNRKEEEFRVALVTLPAGAHVYSLFCQQFAAKTGLDEETKKSKRGLLASRPFFRERQPICAGVIGNGIRQKAPEGLFPFHINFNFVKFALESKGWQPPPSLLRCAKEITKVRRLLIEQNVPLAISQARMFWRRAPVKMRDKRFSAMDFIQVAIEGLISAIDKFCLPTDDLRSLPERTKVWRSVAIGRMRGNFIEMFSSTNLHFYPDDRRKIYRANKHLRHFQSGSIDFERLSWRVNADLEKDGLHTTAKELTSLMGASAWTGDPAAGYRQLGSIENPSTITEAAQADESWRPDVRYEKAEVRERVKEIISKLDIPDRKILFLRGIDPEQI